MSVGLSNASVNVQVLMERCVKNLHHCNCLIFLDNIIILTEVTTERIKTVLKNLEQHNHTTGSFSIQRNELVACDMWFQLKNNHTDLSKIEAVNDTAHTLEHKG